MTLNERYRIHNKSKSNRVLWLYLLIALFFVCSSSFARYTSSFDSGFDTDVAKWCIKINEIEITQNTDTIRNEMNLVVTENKTEDGLIKAGQKGYFDIKIDPQYTEVSLKYTLKIDNSNLPKEIEFKTYSINDFENKYELPENKTIEGNIALEGKSSLEATDVKVYRVYWEWPVEKTKIENIQSDYKVKANIEVEQIVK